MPIPHAPQVENEERPLPRPLLGCWPRRMVFGKHANSLLFPSKKDLAQLFRKFDGNGNGRLSYGEIEDAVYSLWP